MQKILIVDDDAIHCRVIDLILTEFGYKCVRAKHGADAVSKLLDAPKDYNLILADRVMPKMDAKQLLNFLHNNQDIPAIPVIVFTGEAETEEIAEIFSAGAKELLYKPVAKDLLLPVVERVLNAYKV